MKNRYNLYNLEALFKKWLIAGKNIRRYWRNSKKISRHSHPGYSPITIKNYLSDLRHFLGWSVFKLKVKDEKLKIDKLPPNEFVFLIDKPLVEEYKKYLVSNKIPLKTVNRRLSTLRKFFSFCIDQGWIRENPAKKVTNINLSKKSTPDDRQIESNLLQQFHQHLLKENLDPLTIKSYLDDVREFLRSVLLEGQTLKEDRPYHMR